MSTRKDQLNPRGITQDHYEKVLERQSGAARGARRACRTANRKATP